MKAAGVRSQLTAASVSSWLTLVAAVLAIGACQGNDAADGPGAAADGGSVGSSVDAGSEVAASVAYLTPTQHLVRASMALRGVRPSPDELAAVAKNPKYVAAIVDYYLKSPEFGTTLRELHAETLLSSVDPVIYPAGFPSVGALAGQDMQAVNESITDAPLRLIEHVIMNDRPYSEIVTADYALADRTVATIWGMSYDDKTSGWQESKYDDGRPQAGILSDSFLFTRHGTTYSNVSRGRANMVARALLCSDFLDRDIAIDTSINLADTAAVTNAVQNNPTCKSCHETLDPLAAYFAAFRPIYLPSDIKSYPFENYNEGYQEPFSVAKPGFFGQSAKDLVGLGKLIAADPRFAICATKHFYSFLAQVELNAIPEDEAISLNKAFVDGGMDAKQLARAIVLSDSFRASHSVGDASSAESDALVGLKRTRPEQLARSIEALTGYRFATTLPIEIKKGSTVGDVDLMTDSFFGFKVLAGGIDGNAVTRPAHTQTATAQLVTENIAARAAQFVVDNDFAKTDLKSRKLFGEISATDTSDASVRKQLASLWLRVFGELVSPDAADLDDAVALFKSAAADGGAKRAWSVTLYALLQDPRFTFY